MKYLCNLFDLAFDGNPKSKWHAIRSSSWIEMHMGTRLPLGCVVLHENEAGRNGSISGRYPGSMKIEGGDKFHDDEGKVDIIWKTIYESDNLNWITSRDPNYVHETKFVIDQSVGPFSWYRFSFNNSDKKGGDTGPGHGGKRLSIYDMQLFDNNSQPITIFKSQSKLQIQNAC
jgi:hypothetical protein